MYFFNEVRGHEVSVYAVHYEILKFKLDYVKMSHRRTEEKRIKTGLLEVVGKFSMVRRTRLYRLNQTMRI